MVIAGEGTAVCAIALADNASAPEQKAGAELAAYLTKVTGGEFVILKEGQALKPGPRIYVGPTQFAKEKGIDCERLSAEHWVMRTFDGNLVLAGGRPRGTLYAVHHFLEDVVGVHWWSPWDESVPTRANLSVGKLDRQGEPAFRNRCLDPGSGLFWKTAPPFAPRNRINRILGYAPIPLDYGGSPDFGPPQMVHSEFNYMRDWFKDGTLAKHPDWVAKKDGKREVFAWTGAPRLNNHLCLSNVGMRATFLGKLRGYIRQTREEPVPPMIFDVSPGDSPHMCECEACQAAIKKYGGKNSGLLLDFTNYLADGVKNEYPDVMIETLAYLSTEDVPVGIVPRDNVIITLCDTRSNITVPIPVDGYFAQRLSAWSKIANKLYVWDYHINRDAAPVPFDATFQQDLQFFQKNHVVGYMTEYHSGIFPELRDMRLWLLAKLLEDPSQNQAELVKTFTDGFYGPAGVYVRRYIESLRKTVQAHPVHLGVSTKLEQCKYLTPDFLHQSQDIFDEAEKAVAGSETFPPRVRHARMALDTATLAMFPKILGKWQADGKQREDLWLKRETVAARVKETLGTEWQRRVDLPSMMPYFQKRLAEGKKKFLARIDAYLQRSPLVINPPAKFAHLIWRDYTAFAADAFATYGHPDKAKMVEDKRTQNGIAVRAEMTDKLLAALKGNALRWAMHDHGKDNKNAPTSGLKIGDIVPGNGYHWYKLGTYALNTSSFLWLYGVNAAVALSEARDPLLPSGRFEIWARVRFDGPAFRNGANGDPNVIALEWVVAVKEKTK